ncbi:hypothetical protein TNCT_502611 [Trichonephila clavata]|uniref:Uncharacterized protein n=1 Tax=Trichonephila clavata TaxID=2740835 RepID=A0A8X6KZP5_TRICU|nr:hypothetical protein TNCT_502611 [Trichonephila clavata]
MYGLGIKISLLFLIAFALVRGNEEVENYRNCSNERFLACYEIMPQEMKEADDYPDEGVLDRSCPELRKMTECFESYIDDCVNTGDWLFPFYAHSGKFIKELCNKDSIVRANYLQHVACYRELDSNGTFKKCFNNASATVQNYIEAGGYINTDVEDYHRGCLTAVHAYLCETIEVAKTCGQEAFRAYFAMGKVKDSIKGIRFACASIDFDEEVRTGFFSRFDINPNEAYIYNEVFDYFRERMEPEVKER